MLLPDVMHILVPAVWGLSALVTALHFVHMLQLSSYQPPGYLRWFRRHGVDALARLVWVVPTLFLWLWRDDRVLYALVFFYALLAVVARPLRKAKKPLKFTSRVIRLLVTLALLFSAVSWAVWRFRPETGDRWLPLILLGLGYLLTPLWVLLANLINMPIQKGIETFYIRDARRRLDTHPGLIILGVTGSYGKTSTKHFLQRLLSEKYNTLMTPGSYNTPMGVVRTVRERLLPTHEVFVCEMGARHVGDIKKLCQIARPRHGLLTSVGPQHLETFGTQEAIANEKFQLIHALPSGGLAFLNMSSPLVKNHPLNRPAVRYGISEETDHTLDYRAFDLKAGPEGLDFSVETKAGETARFSTALIGRHNVENITAAIAVAHKLGVPLARLVSAVRTLKPTSHRLQLLTPAAGLTIIDDAFNANPEGARIALETLAGFDGLKLLVTPGFIELGDRQDACHEELGRQAAVVCDFVALVGVKQTEAIVRGLTSSGFPGEKLFVGETFQECMTAVRDLPADGRTKFVLLENDLPDHY